MDKLDGRCLKNPRIPGAVDLGAALQELGSLSGHREGRENTPRDRRLLRESRTLFFEQSPPVWTGGGPGPVIGSPPSLRVDTAHSNKDPPLQPPNSPVSPQLPYEQFKIREGLSDAMPQRCEWDGRLLAGRRISTKGRQRMLSGPNGSSTAASSSAISMHGDRYPERLRDRSSWRPYRIPRPKLLNMGHCSRVRTVSATLHEEPSEQSLSIGRLMSFTDASPVASTADALRCMAINGDALSHTLDTNSDCIVSFPLRSRSVENLERRAMDVAANALDTVSDKIEKLHVA